MKIYLSEGFCRFLRLGLKIFVWSLVICFSAFAPSDPLRAETQNNYSLENREEFQSPSYHLVHPAMSFENERESIAEIHPLDSPSYVGTSWLIRSDSQSPLTSPTEEDVKPSAEQNEFRKVTSKLEYYSLKIKSGAAAVRLHILRDKATAKILVLAVLEAASSEVKAIHSEAMKVLPAQKGLRQRMSEQKGAAQGLSGLTQKNGTRFFSKMSQDSGKIEISVEQVVSWLDDGLSLDEIKQRMNKMMQESQIAKKEGAKRSLADPEEGSLEAVTKNANITQKVADYMWTNFEVASDQRQFGKEDYWQSPAELLKNKKGDCEDLALFAQKMLNLYGVPALVMNIYGNRYAHTVTVSKQKGAYRVFDGVRMREIRAKNLVDLVMKIYPHWKQMALVSYSENLHQGTVQRAINRPDTGLVL